MVSLLTKAYKRTEIEKLVTHRAWMSPLWGAGWEEEKAVCRQKGQDCGHTPLPGSTDGLFEGSQGSQTGQFRPKRAGFGMLCRLFIQGVHCGEGPGTSDCLSL